MAKAIQENQIREVDDREVDVEFLSPNQFVGTHVNLIPLQNAVQSARLFYGGRFYDQALPLKSREAPLVQNLADGDEEGRSFDELMGSRAGALRADTPGTVESVDKNRIVMTTDEGKRKEIPLYNNFQFNRKTSIRHIPKVKVGDRLEKGSLLAASNYTDDSGTLAMGLNARVAVVPYKGYSVEDAIVVSDDFAKRLTSEHTDQFNQDYDKSTRGGKEHFRSLFPTKFKQSQIDKLDDDGVVTPGTVLQPGDPMILVTQPRVLSSNNTQVGKLSKVMRQARKDSSQVWDAEEPGTVQDVVKTRKGVRVIVTSELPTDVSDKIVFRSGNKAIISKILPRDQMPRTLDGEPMDVLLNPLSLPSRVNSATTLELALGKIAKKTGKVIKIPGFNKPGEKWFDYVQDLQKKYGIEDKEKLYDPIEDRIYQNPVQVGDGYILKLHHVGHSKRSERGVAGYDIDQQPSRGGREGAGAKRLSGLETQSLLSSGAYANLREGATVRGQANDEFWRALRSGQPVKSPGEPFVWSKFQALLAGAGINARKIDGGKLRLGPITDRELERRKAVRINKGELVNSRTLDPIPGGLFDPDIVSANKWGYIDLPFPVVNPAFEDSILKILGITKKQFRDVMAGKEELKID